MIEDIVQKPKNNPIKTFEKFAEIEDWLRSQWSGLFRDLLGRLSEDKKISDLKDQISDLRDVTDTLKSYMESLLQQVAPKESEDLIRFEHSRAEEAKTRRLALENRFVEYMGRFHAMDSDTTIDIIKNSRIQEAEKICSRG